MPIVLEQNDIFKHLNNISWNRAKLILSTVINSILLDYSPLEDPYHEDIKHIITYFKYCRNDRKLQFIRWSKRQGVF